MSVVCYRCPKTGEEVTTAIETSKDTLVKMRAMDLTMWVWCPHCMAGDHDQSGAGRELIRTPAGR
jgi:hypothetical protein